MAKGKATDSSAASSANGGRNGSAKGTSSNSNTTNRNTTDRHTTDKAGIRTPTNGAGNGSGHSIDTTDRGIGILSPRTGDLPGQDSEHLTTAQGVGVTHTDDSLKAGPRGPVVMDDFHLREKVMHFDHERIPERVVHARGVGVHGEFTAFGTASDVTKADFLQAGRVTPVFTRFSTVVGSRGSADTARDVRGFATKFYTREGVFDLVGNNIPVFFIRDAIKFPDLIHAAKPEPDLEIPQAATAHTTFWDFVSLIPESPHMLMWAMSDRAIPRSLRMMEGFGVHTFRLVNERGETTLAKWHWKPKLGVHGLLWEEAQVLAGVNPDFHRRDLYGAIAAGKYPQWELGLQVFPDTEDQMFEGIDLLDSTKLVPEELAPVMPVGLLELNRNPSNYFAETEQVAFHVGHLVSGIEATDDPLLHGRLFSYLDTQLTRLGGPNFAQIPINRPHSAVNDNLRDGFMQMAVHEGRSPYLPNSAGGGCPFLADAANGGYAQVPRPVSGVVTRERVQADDNVQAAMFYRSLTQVEKDHLVNAFRFELGHVDIPAVVDRMLARLADVDAELCELVAAGLGLAAPQGSPVGDVQTSPALAMIRDEPTPIDGRVVQILAADGADVAGMGELKAMLVDAGLIVHVLAPHKGVIRGRQADEVAAVDRSFLTASSAEADAFVIAGGAISLRNDAAVQVYLQTAFRHHKTIAAWGDGQELLAITGIDPDAEGIFASAGPDRAFADAIVAALGHHRHWGRMLARV